MTDTDVVLWVVLLAAVLLTGSGVRRLIDWLGPLFVVEWNRIARSRWLFRFRIGFGLVLLLLLSVGFVICCNQVHLDPWSVAQGAVELPPATAGSLSISLTRMMLTMQLVGLLFLTPAYILDGLPAGKDRATLSLLRITGLSAHEILLGQVTARLLHLLGAFLLSLPILVAFQVWGGPEPMSLIAYWILSVAAILAVAWITLLSGIKSKQSWQAALPAYLSALGMFMYSFLFQVVFHIDSLKVMVNVTLLLLLLPGGLMLILAGAAIQQFKDYRTDLKVHFDFPSEPVSLPPIITLELHQPVRPRGSSPRRRPTVTVTDPPLEWKERHHLRCRFHGNDPRMVISLVIVILFFLVGLLLPWEQTWDNRKVWNNENQLSFVGVMLNPVLRLMLTLLGLGIWITAGIYSTSCISTERESDTLQTLLVLPVDRDEIFWAKCRATVWLVQPLLLIWGGLWLVGVLTYALHPIAACLLIGSFAVHVFLIAAMGLLFSVLCQRTLQALFGLVAALMLFIGGFSMIEQTLRSVIDYAEIPGLLSGLIPPWCWWTQSVPVLEWEQSNLPTGDAPQQRILVTLWGVAFSALLTVGLGSLARWRFHRLTL